MRSLLLLGLYTSIQVFKYASGLASKPIKRNLKTSSNTRNKINRNTFEGPGLLTFEKQWNEIQLMLNNLKEAPPIESMGADALAGYGNVKQTMKKDRNKEIEYRFQTLIATMLSPQTKDAQTAQGFNNLVDLVSPLPLVASSLANLDEEEIASAINMVSFYKIKAKNIKLAAIKCVEEFNSDIPTDIDDLLAFKGVGPKVGYLTFTIARGETLGICVDTHVHRISNKLGWVDTATVKSNGPEKTRLQLQSWLPKEYWSDVNRIIVGFGQAICDAKSPKCNSCSISNTCNYYNRKDEEGEKLRASGKSRISPLKRSTSSSSSSSSSTLKKNTNLSVSSSSSSSSSTISTTTSSSSGVTLTIEHSTS